MATIIRVSGFRVTIFTNDHRPAHVHVFKAGGEAVIALQPVSIRVNYRMSRKDLRKAVEVVEMNRERLLRAWREIHGDE